MDPARRPGSVQMLRKQDGERSEGARPGPAGAARRLGLVLRNDGHALARLREAVDAFTRPNAFSEEEGIALQRCLGEILARILTNGFDSTDRHRIDLHIQLQADTGTLVIWIRDDGHRINSFRADYLPDLDASPRNRSSGSPGTCVAYRYADRVSYFRQNGRNHLIMSRKVRAG